MGPKVTPMTMNEGVSIQHYLVQIYPLEAYPYGLVLEGADELKRHLVCHVSKSKWSIISINLPEVDTLDEGVSAIINYENEIRGESDNGEETLPA